jgi:hypothetical protein
MKHRWEETIVFRLIKENNYQLQTESYDLVSKNLINKLHFTKITFWHSYYLVGAWTEEEKNTTSFSKNWASYCKMNFDFVLVFKNRIFVSEQCSSQVKKWSKKNRISFQKFSFSFSLSSGAHLVHACFKMPHNIFS